MDTANSNLLAIGSKLQFHRPPEIMLSESLIPISTDLTQRIRSYGNTFVTFPLRI